MTINLIHDATFLDKIGVNGETKPWSDWTNVNITTIPNVSPLPGDYARLPVGADLYQDFSPLNNAHYNLTFWVRNESDHPANLVFELQQESGTPIATLFADGLAAEISLKANSGWVEESLDFDVSKLPFPVDELAFSNSYDAAIGAIANSKNPAGTLIDIADVSLTQSTNVISDGHFLDPIGTGSHRTPWSDWTDAGITRIPGTSPVIGNYAKIPVGGDLFQDFSPLSNGEYLLSFEVINPSNNKAELVVQAQQALGVPISTLFQDHLAAEVTLAAHSGWIKENILLDVNNDPFSVNELAFSNSYDAAIGPITNSKNPAGTIIDVGNVSLTPYTTPNLIADGNFLHPIGTGTNETPWSDWTDAGITRTEGALPVSGDYATLPVGADLFQDFAELKEGDYQLAFLIDNFSHNSANLVFQFQQFGGIDTTTLSQDGLLKEVALPSQSGWSKETFNFSVGALPFAINELSFSNSYDAPVGPISNSVNPAGTEIGIANVSLIRT